MTTLLRLNQVMEILQVSASTVRRRIREGKLIAHCPHPGRKGARITQESLDRFIADNLVPPEKWEE